MNKYNFRNGCRSKGCYFLKALSKQFKQTEKTITNSQIKTERLIIKLNANDKNIFKLQFE